MVRGGTFVIRAQGVDVLLHAGEAFVFAQLAVRNHEAVVGRLLREHLLVIPLVVLQHQGVARELLILADGLPPLLRQEGHDDRTV